MYRVRVIACGVFILVAQPALAFNQLDGQDCLHQRDNDLRIEACHLETFFFPGFSNFSQDTHGPVP